MICTSHKILFRLSNQEELDGQGMWHIWGEEGCVQDLVGKPERKGPYVIPRHRWECNVKLDLHEIES